jgi:hypothetical protein
MDDSGTGLIEASADAANHRDMATAAMIASLDNVLREANDRRQHAERA